MITDIERFNYKAIREIPTLPGKKDEQKIIDIVTAFDIETTRLPEIEQSFMYIWQFQFGPEITVIGRTWEEFKLFLERMKAETDGNKIVCYCHNLSFEIQFLKGVFEFKPEDVFILDDRKVLKCIIDDFLEIRCSYMLTNLSLDKFLKKYNVENKKLTGQFDYSVIRYPWTELNETEMEYCINDVKGLVQAVTLQMNKDGDNLKTIPLTSTGYVRRDTRSAMKKFNYKELHELLPDVTVYKLLREAFRGGDTLSNRWNTDEIISNVKSVDIVSSYPTSLIIDKYPMTRFYREETSSFEDILKAGTHALLFQVAFININVKNPAEGHLYLSRDKCREVVKPTYVNGRVLCADFLETTLTDVDFDIIKRRYKFDRYIIIQLFSSRYKRLPSMLRDVIMNYYRNKTILKGSQEGTDDYLFYMKNKELLNACYGMMAQDPGKDDIKLIDGVYVHEDKPLSELIAKYNKNAFLSYAWGVWCTAWSRKRLADGIDCITNKGKSPANFVYSDTDSIKYIGNVNIDKLNDRLISEAIHSDAYATDRNGEVHFMGVFEDEGYKIPNRFKTMGAKKYVLEDSEKNLHITIAGVNKSKGAKELGKLENFQEGFVFRKAGGTESVYNDNIDMYIEAEGKPLHITDNLVIRDSEYTLGITAEYRRILDGLISIKYSDQDIDGLFKVKR